MSYLKIKMQISSRFQHKKKTTALFQEDFQSGTFRT